jgi:NNP family nitrate/nitrite transporter-like MFS transporter
LADQLSPLKELRVWRFGVYYYFVFGGFVALALWLPKYYVAEYSMDLKTASLITMCFTLPSGLIRALGGWMSDKFGARNCNWIVFWVCLVCLFFVSYPQTTYIVHGIEGDMTFNLGVNVWLFTVLIFIVGIAMGIGKASVYRIIHDYYPDNMGSVGGMVGVIGGLGGFSLPIFFGMASDLFNVRSSCFMLLFGVVAACMIMMHISIRNMRKSEGLELEGHKA